jgi:DoxX-like family
MIFPALLTDIRGSPAIGGDMARKIAYWVSTGLVALSLLSASSYLTGSEQVVSGFTRAGYPQYLRIVLGVAKPVAAIILLLPGLALLKEWAYAGATFALVMAFISHYTMGDGPKVWSMPLLLLALLIVSYLTRPPSRRGMLGSPSTVATRG